MARKPTINSDSVAQDQIRAFVERIERMDEEIRAMNDDKKEIYAEAKGNGFDTVALKHVIKIRRQDHAERMEREAIIELYMAALGMVDAPRDYDDDDHVPGRGVPAPARAREIIEEFDAETGEIEPSGNSAELVIPPTDELLNDPERMYAVALQIVRAEQKASPSLLQRRLSIGYNKACYLIERMEAEGVCSPANHAGLRTIIEPSNMHNLHNAPDPSLHNPQTTQPATDPKQSTAAATEGGVPERASLSVTNHPGGENANSVGNADASHPSLDHPETGAPATEGDDAPPASSVVAFKLSDKPLRPYCLKIGTDLPCGGQGRSHCFPCEQAHASRTPVEAGGTEIKHRGSING